MPIRCELCGQESELDHLYGKWKRSFRSRIYTACPNCLNQKARKQNAALVWFHCCFGIIVVIALCLDRNSHLGWEIFNLFILTVFSILAVIWHELGHALMGQICKLRIFHIVIGCGKLLFERRLFGFQWRFHAIPLVGAVYGLPADYHWFRLRMLLFVLGGPLANLLIVALIFPWIEFEGSGRFSLGHGPLPLVTVLFLTNILTFIGAIFPYQILSAGRPLSSDGLLIYQTLFKPISSFSDQKKTYYLWAAEESRRVKNYEEALDLLTKGCDEFPGNEYLLNARAVMLLEQGKIPEAREMFLSLLEKSQSDPNLKYHLLNNIAYVDVFLLDPKLLPEADSFSNEACKNIPWLPQFKGTRGVVLFEMGRLEEAISYLEDALKNNDLARNRSVNAAYLAMAENKIGNREKAQEYLKLAQKLDPQCVVLERVEKELAGGQFKAGNQTPV